MPLDVLNDVVQEFINQIVFIRICEDKNLPLYHKLKDTITDSATLQKNWKPSSVMLTRDIIPVCSQEIISFSTSTTALSQI